jgi:lysophospholipid acyltransferase (LPLAT)-like uncharacterized protein
MRYRVHDVPLILRPFYFLVSWILGLFLYTVAALIRSTCRIRTVGEEHLQERSNFIFCLWHDNVFPYFVSVRSHARPHMWMNHPAWYMKPIHVVIKLIGVQGLILGSTGHSGQAAAAKLVEELRSGYSTVVLPDGPAGPPKVLKKGALHMALQSGVPIVPMKILTPRCFVLKKTWEGKRIPYPFSSIEIRYERPITVTETGFEEEARQLTEAMG